MFLRKAEEVLEKLCNDVRMPAYIVDAASNIYDKLQDRYTSMSIQELLILDMLVYDYDHGVYLLLKFVNGGGYDCEQERGA